MACFKNVSAAEKHKANIGAANILVADQAAYCAIVSLKALNLMDDNLFLDRMR